MLQGKVFDKPPLTLKNILKEKSITVFYVEDQVRFKLEIKAIDNILELRLNPTNGSLDVSFKKAIKYKFYKQENGEPKWMLTTEIKDEKISITTTKDPKALRSYFEGIVPEECIRMDVSDAKLDDKSALGDATERDDVQDADDVVNFPIPTAQQLADTEKFRKAISSTLYHI